MSSPSKYKLYLSPQAETDIEDILHYTYQTYGEEQEGKYYNILCDALDLIESNPFAGHKRPDLSERHRSLTAGQHVIVYQVSEPKIFVSRILHSRMDFIRQLPNE
jgi:plasmid stabilization system protein ParE